MTHTEDPEYIEEETLEEHKLNEADDWYSAQRADGRLEWMLNN